jgi:hypothetical protein
MLKTKVRLTPSPDKSKFIGRNGNVNGDGSLSAANCAFARQICAFDPEPSAKCLDNATICMIAPNPIGASAGDAVQIPIDFSARIGAVYQYDWFAAVAGR